MSTIIDQLETLAHAARALNGAGCVVLEARASCHAQLLPLIQTSYQPPSCMFNAGEITRDTDKTGSTCSVQSDRLGVCITWEEKR